MLRNSAGSSLRPRRLEHLTGHFSLDWSHCLTLLSVSDPDVGRPYEIEPVENGWSVRELKRQCDSCLHERLPLSRDKKDTGRLGRKGHVRRKGFRPDRAPGSAGVPWTGGEDRVLRSDLETAIIDRLKESQLQLGGVSWPWRARSDSPSTTDTYSLISYPTTASCASMG